MESGDADCVAQVAPNAINLCQKPWLHPQHQDAARLPEAGFPLSPRYALVITHIFFGHCSEATGAVEPASESRRSLRSSPPAADEPEMWVMTRAYRGEGRCAVEEASKPLTQPSPRSTGERGRRNEK